MSHRIKVLSFDLDDTLWPCYPTILNAENILYQWLQSHVPEITCRYDIDALREKRQSLKSSQHSLAHDLTQLRLQSFAELSEELEIDKDWIQPAFDVFHEARQQVTLFDDVKPVLDELEQDFRLVSLTNGNADTVKTGVAHWFSLALNSISVGKQKSQPEIYHQVQKQMNIEAYEMVHIGDDPVQDVYGAQSAGVKAIWLNRDKKQWQNENFQPDAVINDLHELITVLKNW